MKKAVLRAAAVAAIALICLFAACGCTGSSSSVPDASLEYNDTRLALGDESFPLVQKIGLPLSYLEAMSCAFDGVAITYTYPGFVMRTYNDGVTDRIHNLRITDDTVETNEGIRFGDTLSEVISAYGENYARNGEAVLYEYGSFSIEFILEDDRVISISYTKLDI